MQEALNQKIDAFVAANKEQILKDIATLVSINSMESNVINIVIPETQLAQCTQRERQIVQTLYTKIDANAVKSLDITGGGR